MKIYSFWLVAAFAYLNNIGLPTSTTPNLPLSCQYNAAQIAGKTQSQIAKLYGKPTSAETVKPSRTPCPCPKRIYKGGEIEIVFINGKADWITINVGRDCEVKSGGYPMQRFDDYAYIKAFTR